MNSCLYFGKVSHHRKAPKKHDLRYDVYMAHLFLDELNEVFKDRWFWSVNSSNLGGFQRSDYHRPEVTDLADAVRQTMSAQLGEGNQWANFHHNASSYLWVLFQPCKFLFSMERGSYPTNCLNG